MLTTWSLPVRPSLDLASGHRVQSTRSGVFAPGQSAPHSPAARVHPDQPVAENGGTTRDELQHRASRLIKQALEGWHTGRANSEGSIHAQPDRRALSSLSTVHQHSPPPAITNDRLPFDTLAAMPSPGRPIPRAVQPRRRVTSPRHSGIVSKKRDTRIASEHEMLFRLVMLCTPLLHTAEAEEGVAAPKAAKITTPQASRRDLIRRTGRGYRPRSPHGKHGRCERTSPPVASSNA